jgi:hypothetical protein
MRAVREMTGSKPAGGTDSTEMLSEVPQDRVIESLTAEDAFQDKPRLTHLFDHQGIKFDEQSLADYLVAFQLSRLLDTTDMKLSYL